MSMCPTYMFHQKSTSEGKGACREAMMTGAQCLVMLADFTAWLNGKALENYSTGACLATHLYLYNGTNPPLKPSTN